MKDDKRKLIMRNFWIIIAVSVILAIIGIGTINDAEGRCKTKSGAYLTSSCKEEKDKEYTQGSICLVAGIGVAIAGFIYKNHSIASIVISSEEERKNEQKKNDEQSNKKKKIIIGVIVTIVVIIFIMNIIGSLFTRKIINDLTNQNSMETTYEK